MAIPCHLPAAHPLAAIPRPVAHTPTHAPDDSFPSPDELSGPALAPKGGPAGRPGHPIRLRTPHQKPRDFSHAALRPRAKAHSPATAPHRELFAFDPPATLIRYPPPATRYPLSPTPYPPPPPRYAPCRQESPMHSQSHACIHTSTLRLTPHAGHSALGTRRAIDSRQPTADRRPPTADIR
jgi:hypothetical protein